MAARVEASVTPDLLAGVEAYYTQKILRHGATPLGVDWPCARSQELRFAQLLKVCDFSAPFALNDLGCGYGALAAYLVKCHPGARVSYLGIDLSPEMIRRARQLRQNHRFCKFIVGNSLERKADYSIASGIFNVKLAQATERWESFIVATLIAMHSCSTRGFAVNFLAPQDRGQPVRRGLYRTPPVPWVRYCERRFHCSVELIGAYGLREFTLLVRRGD
jgi:SAM-dependent methyltransferase